MRRFRIEWSLLLCLGGLAALTAETTRRLVKLHLSGGTDGPAAAATRTAGGKASKNPTYRYTKEAPGMRGGIYFGGRRKEPLAVSTAAWEYHVDPGSINTNATKAGKKPHTPESVAIRVADKLGLPYGEVLAKFRAKGKGRYIPLKISAEAATSSAAHDYLSTNSCISGLVIEDSQLRNFPGGDRLGTILGYFNAEGKPFFGIEQSFDEYLRGVPGRIEGQRDAFRREIPDKRVFKSDPIPGADVFLTLDCELQLAAEEALAAAVATNNAVSGFAIVEEVDTGRILAMASYPDFHPLDRKNARVRENRHRALSYVYEPGSLMKVLTCAAALEEGVLTPDTKLPIGQGSWHFAGHVLHDHPTGTIDCRDAIAKSSNIYFAKTVVGDPECGFKGMGSKKLYSYFKAFGLGEAPQVGIPGAEKGIVGNPKKWGELGAARVPIGQGISVTGIQIATAFAAIANGGVRMKPYLVDRVVARNGDVLMERKPEAALDGKPVISPDKARQLIEMMKGTATREGTARRAAVRGYSVAGKTGTAQQIEARTVVRRDRDGNEYQKTVRGYSSRNYCASFCGIIPADRPKLAILVTIDRPQPIHTGGYVSAPAFRKIAERAVRVLEIQPDRPEELLEDEEREWRESLRTGRRAAP